VSERATYRLTIVANEPYPFLLGVILRNEAIPNRLALRGGRFDGVVTVMEWSSFRSLADRIQERFGQFELQRVNQVETTGEPLGSGQLARVFATELSEEQLLVLETAYRMGYFDVPRTASAEEIAAELDIAQSTLSERLRVAERRLFELVFGTGGDASSLEDVGE
jgi:predicted DNA binding protein